MSRPGTTSEVDAFERAQERLLERFDLQVDSRFVDVPAIGGRAHCLVTGEGAPAVMLNGIGTPAAMWAPLMPRLSGFTLYGLDLPAYGLTDTTADLTDDLRANAVRFLEQALDGLGLERPAFVGNSLGSLWATWLALDRPERAAALVHVGCPALILGSSAPFPMRLLSVRLLGRLLTTLQPPSPRQVDRLAAMANEDFSHLPELRDLLVATERLPGFRPTFLSMLNVGLRLRGARPELTLTEEQLARVGQPVQLIWGADDPFGSTEIGERAAAIMPRAELHVVDGGHAPWIDEPARIADLIAAFLNEHGSPGAGPGD